MSHQHSSSSFGNFGGLVNGLVIFAAVTVIAAGYVSAIGSFAGVA